MFGVHAVPGSSEIGHQSVNSRVSTGRFVRVMRIRVSASWEEGDTADGVTCLCVVSAGFASVEGRASTWSTAHDHPMMPPT